MAIGATIHTFTVQLSDIDRGVYDELSIRVARHPSETDAYMLTRVLAYCLEYEEGIDFSEGISATDEPAVLVRDLTGALVAWIEVGAPDAARLHTGSMKAARTIVYTHRDADKVAAPWAGKRIHRGDEVLLHSFDPGSSSAWPDTSNDAAPRPSRAPRGGSTSSSTGCRARPTSTRAPPPDDGGNDGAPAPPKRVGARASSR